MHQKQTMAFFTIAILATLIFIATLCLSVHNYNAKKKELEEKLAKSEELREASLTIGQADLIKYTPDGKHIYALRRRNPDIGITKPILYQAALNPFKSKKIPVNAEEIIPSPSGKYLLLDSGMKDGNGLYAITIIDSSTHAKIKTIRKNNPLSPYGWRGKRSSIWYSDEEKNTVYIIDLENQEEYKLGTGFGLNWSDNGRFFAYSQSFSGDNVNNIEYGDELFVYDDTKNTRKSIVKEPFSKITNAIFSHDNKTIYYILTKDSTSTTRSVLLKESRLKSVDLNGRNDQLLWSTEKDSEVPTKTSTLVITGLTLSATGDELLFMARDWIGITNIDIKFCVHDKTYDRIAPGFSAIWDYSPVKNTIAWLDTNKHLIIEKKLD